MARIADYGMVTLSKEGVSCIHLTSSMVGDALDKLERQGGVRDNATLVVDVMFDHAGALHVTGVEYKLFRHSKGNLTCAEILGLHIKGLMQIRFSEKSIKHDGQIRRVSKQEEISFLVKKAQALMGRPWAVFVDNTPVLFDFVGAGSSGAQDRRFIFAPRKYVDTVTVMREMFDHAGDAMSYANHVLTTDLTNVLNLSDLKVKYVAEDRDVVLVLDRSLKVSEGQVRGVYMGKSMKGTIRYATPLERGLYTGFDIVIFEGNCKGSSSKTAKANFVGISKSFDWCKDKVGSGPSVLGLLFIIAANLKNPKATQLWAGILEKAKSKVDGCIEMLRAFTIGCFGSKAEENLARKLILTLTLQEWELLNREDGETYTEIAAEDMFLLRSRLQGVNALVLSGAPLNTTGIVDVFCHILGNRISRIIRSLGMRAFGRLGTRYIPELDEVTMGELVDVDGELVKVVAPVVVVSGCNPKLYGKKVVLHRMPLRSLHGMQVVQVFSPEHFGFTLDPKFIGMQTPICEPMDGDTDGDTYWMTTVREFAELVEYAHASKVFGPNLPDKLADQKAAGKVLPVHVIGKDKAKATPEQMAKVIGAAAVCGTDSLGLVTSALMSFVDLAAKGSNAHFDEIALFALLLQVNSKFKHVTVGARHDLDGKIPELIARISREQLFAPGWYDAIKAKASCNLFQSPNHRAADGMAETTIASMPGPFQKLSQYAVEQWNENLPFDYKDRQGFRMECRQVWYDLFLKTEPKLHISAQNDSVRKVLDAGKNEDGSRDFEAVVEAAPAFAKLVRNNGNNPKMAYMFMSAWLGANMQFEGLDVQNMMGVSLWVANWCKANIKFSPITVKAMDESNTQEQKVDNMLIASLEEAGLLSNVEEGMQYKLSLGSDGNLSIL